MSRLPVWDRLPPDRVDWWNVPPYARSMAETVRSRRRVALRDVAERAGCGTTTVSDILNRGVTDKYPQETRDRVIQAMRDTGLRAPPSRPAAAVAAVAGGGPGDDPRVRQPLLRPAGPPVRGAAAEHAVTTRACIVIRQDLGTLSGFSADLLGEDVDGLIFGPVYSSHRFHQPRARHARRTLRQAGGALRRRRVRARGLRAGTRCRTEEAGAAWPPRPSPAAGTGGWSFWAATRTLCRRGRHAKRPASPRPPRR